MLKFALIGAGRIGKVHAESVMTRVPTATIVAIADPIEAAAQELASKYNVDTVTTNASEIITRDDVDAVMVCSSTDTHQRFILEAARAGKQIFCEKPLDVDLGRIDEAIKVTKESGVKFMLGFQRRFDPTFKRVKAAIDSGEIGTPHLMHLISRDPAPPPIDYIKVSGGIFMDMMIHDFDMARFLLGEVEEMYAMGGVMVDPAIGEAGDIDTAMVSLKFENGAMGVIDNSRKAVYGYDQRAEVFGTGGSVQSENHYPNNVTLNTGSAVQKGSLPLHFFLERYMEAYGAEVEVFVDCIQNDKPVPVTGADGRAPVVMAMAAKKSLEENRPVKLSEIG